MGVRSTGRRGAALEAPGPSERTRGASGRSSYSLQFSSSLPSGQSSNPLHWKRPMMQWMPLAQGKNVGPHFDLALATGGKTRQTAGREGVTSLTPGVPIPPTLSVHRGPFTFPLKTPKISYHPPPTVNAQPAWEPTRMILEEGGGYTRCVYMAPAQSRAQPECASRRNEWVSRR